MESPHGESPYGGRVIVQRIVRKSPHGEIASVQRIARDSTAHKRDGMWCSGVRVMGRVKVDRECSSELHSAVWVKYWVRNRRQGQEPRELDVGKENYLLRVILEILLQCSVFITTLVIVSVVSINIVVRSRTFLLNYIILRQMSSSDSNPGERVFTHFRR